MPKIRLFVGLSLLVVCGCTKKEDERLVYVIEAPERQEITSAGSIRHVFGDDGKTLVEKHLPYPEGDKGIVYYRPTDGTVMKTVEIYGRTGHTRSEALWSDDGKTVVAGKVYRPDGTLRLSVERKDDTTTTNLFGKDGKWLVKTTVAAEAKAQREDTFYFADGTVLARVHYEPVERKSRRGVIRTVSETATEIFKGGVKRFRIDNLKDEKKITYYTADGASIAYVQYWRSNFDPKLAAVEEYRGTSVVRKLVFAEDKNVVKLTECHTYPSATVTRSSFFRVEELDVKRVSIETVTSGSDKTERVLHAGTLKRIEETGKNPVEFSAYEGVKEEVEVSLLAKFDHKDLSNARSQLSEELSYLGDRNDEIPCKWYMR